MLQVHFISALITPRVKIAKKMDKLVDHIILRITNITIFF